MRKSKKYKRTRFSADVLKEAIIVLEKQIQAVGGAIDIESDYFRVQFPDESWTYDNIEEFFADYRKGTCARLEITKKVHVEDTQDGFTLDLEMDDDDCRCETTIYVTAPRREQIESVFEVFEKHSIDSRLPEPEELPETKEEKVVPTIFIGHGHSKVWKELKDHLHEQHGYLVEAYETGARAGHAIRNILQSMMSKSAFALLVLTCDDEVGDGIYRARQNVIHETGLFQGRLGFSRAIVLLEDGVDLEDFSNIEGIHQIRFSKDNIRETYGDVLATLRREFGVEN